MLKVMIVDDEFLIRQLLIQCIDWKAEGYQIVADCATAEEAIERMPSLKPDLILTDICMPETDGLTFAEKSKLIQPGVHVIAITGYENFDYARRGIQVGLDDYLLKPVDTGDLKKSVERVKEQIEAENEKENKILELSEFQDHNARIVREYYLHQLIESDYKEEIVSGSYGEYLEKETRSFTDVAVFDLNEKDVGEDYSRMKDQMKNWLVTFFTEKSLPFAQVLDKLNHIVVMVNSKYEDLTSILRACEKQYFLEKSMHLFWGFSQIQEKNTSNTAAKNENPIHTAYLDAVEQLNIAMILGKNGQKRSIENRFENNTGKEIVSIDGIKKIATCISAGDMLEVNKTVEQWFILWQKTTPENLNLIRVQLLNAFFYIVLHCLSEKEDYSKFFWDFYHQIIDMVRLDRMEDSFLKGCEAIYHSDTHKGKEQNSKLIYTVEEYLVNNLDDPDLSLTSVAQKFFLNSSYLSRLFKKKTGKSFIEYLTNLRIEKAQELLKYTDMKIYEVAQKVGIYNSNYFGIIFKKETGKTPIEFRKQ